MKRSTGFTFTELLIVIIGATLLFSIAVSTFLIASKALHHQEERIPVGGELAQGLEKASRELREAAEGSIQKYNGINHTLQYEDTDDGGDSFVLYLYSAADPSLDSSYVPTALYELRMAPLAGFAYGSGRVLARQLFSPNAPNPADQAVIQRRGGRWGRWIEILLTATERSESVSEKSEKVKLRLMIFPRNQEIRRLRRVEL